MDQELFSTFTREDREIYLGDVMTENLEILLQEFIKIFKPYAKNKNLNCSPEGWSQFIHRFALRDLSIKKRCELIDLVGNLLNCDEVYIAEYMFHLSLENFTKWKNGFNLALTPIDAINQVLIIAYKRVSARNLSSNMEMQSIKRKNQ